MERGADADRRLVGALFEPGVIRVTASIETAVDIVPGLPVSRDEFVTGLQPLP